MRIDARGEGTSPRPSPEGGWVGGNQGTREELDVLLLLLCTPFDIALLLLPGLSPWVPAALKGRNATGRQLV